MGAINVVIAIDHRLNVLLFASNKHKIGTKKIRMYFITYRTEYITKIFLLFESKKNSSGKKIEINAKIKLGPKQTKKPHKINQLSLIKKHIWLKNIKTKMVMKY